MRLARPRVPAPPAAPTGSRDTFTLLVTLLTALAMATGLAALTACGPPDDGGGEAAVRPAQTGTCSRDPDASRHASRSCSSESWVMRLEVS